MPAHHNLVGRRFNRLVVVERLEKTSPGQAKFKWHCRCDCGREKAILGDSLVSGKTISCGCYQAEVRIKHGMSRTAYYKTWTGMIMRCDNENYPGYLDYGGRGIIVCKRWYDFNCFREDMGDRPSPTYSIEREDNQKGYEPDNCRWATNTEQQRHKRMQRNNKSGVTGVFWNSSSKKWTALIKVGGKSINLGSFKEIEPAALKRKEAERHYGFHPDHGEAP